MRFSTKTRYAVRALVRLAMESGKSPLKLKVVAASQGVSLKYLEQVMFPLRAGGFVHTLKGSKGGYTLARPPEEISLLDIVRCVEGNPVPVDCVDDGGLSRCPREESCAVREAWVRIRDAVAGEMAKTTLAHLAARQASLDEEQA